MFKFFRKLFQIHDRLNGAGHFHEVYFICNRCNRHDQRIIRCGIKLYYVHCDYCGADLMHVAGVKQWEALTYMEATAMNIRKGAYPIPASVRNENDPPITNSIAKKGNTV